MSPNQDDCAPEKSASPSDPQEQNQDQGVVEPGSAAQGIPMNLDVATANKAPASDEFRLEDCFVCHEWHRPYAAALLETDPQKLLGLIAQAERVIASRYLELYLAENSSMELSDLQNASYALSQMKRALEIAATQQRFLS